MIQTIFVQICSYRDAELDQTIQSAINNATHPERLSFGICYQYGDGEIEPSSFTLYSSQIKVKKIKWTEAKGVGWARNICNSFYSGEEYTLQIDSHHIFKKSWDEELINQWRLCRHPKAVITGYPPGYTYNTNNEILLNEIPQNTMIVKGFDGGFIPTFKSFPSMSVGNIPIRGSFIAGGLMFMKGTVCQEVPYLPEIYFTGEEIIHSLRLFTYGYKVFYPHKWVIHHHYERNGAHRHWTDCFESNDNTLINKLLELTSTSDRFVQGILEGNITENILGTRYSIKDFENYSGVMFKEKILYDKMLQGYEPPFSSNWSNTGTLILSSN